jgi:hypothetical protein
VTDHLDIIVCVPGAEAGEIIPGSTMSACHVCGSSIWVAPSSWRKIERIPSILVTCRDCAIAIVIEARSRDREMDVAPLTSDQVTEIGSRGN